MSDREDWGDVCDNYKKKVEAESFKKMFEAKERSQENAYAKAYATAMKNIVNATAPKRVPLAYVIQVFLWYLFGRLLFVAAATWVAGSVLKKMGIF